MSAEGDKDITVRLIFGVMANYFENRGRFKQGRKTYYREKANALLKYTAPISIGISTIQLFTMAFGFVGILDEFFNKSDAEVCRILLLLHY